MSSPPRRSVRPMSQWFEEDQSGSTFDGESEPDTAPQDPARLAAALLLARAVEVAGTTFDQAGRDGVVTLITLPSLDWSAVVCATWAALARDNQSGIDGETRLHWRHKGWVAWCPAERPKRFDDGPVAEGFATALYQGRHCVGLAADLTWLPADLVQVADFRLAVPALTSVDVATLARELCGEPPSISITDDEASALTPRLLRLGRRLDQTADDYGRRLRAALDALAASNGSSKPKSAVRVDPTLDRLHGMDEAVAWGLTVSRDLQAVGRGEISWQDVDRGCLLSGPPGCGKTLFASALATTCAVPLISGAYGEWHASGSAHQGDFLKAMRKSFAEARSLAPSILFIDEIDSFPNRGTLTHRWADYEIQIVNALLAEIDGVQGRDGVILVAACNHPDKLDPALIRSGRLDRHVRVGLPDQIALVRILREHLGSDLVEDDPAQAALFAAGSSGADCERFVRGARRRAREAGRSMVLADLLDEIGGTGEASEPDVWLSAVHEAGHAVATCILQPGRLRSVSIVGDAHHGGRTTTRQAPSDYLRAADVRVQLIILLAGRAAEEVLLGEASSGAGGSPGSDLALATELAALADMALGLNSSGALLWRGMVATSDLRQVISADRDLARRVQEMLDGAYTAARELVGRHAESIRKIAIALIARRALDGADVEIIVQDTVTSRSE